MFQVSHKLHHWQIAVICKLRMHWLPRPERSECSNSKITRNSVHWSCSRGNQWVTNQSSDDGRGDCNYVWVLIIVIPTITTSIMNVFLLIASRLPNLGNTCYLNACLQVFFTFRFSWGIWELYLTNFWHNQYVLWKRLFWHTIMMSRRLMAI